MELNGSNSIWRNNESQREMADYPLVRPYFKRRKESILVGMYRHFVFEDFKVRKKLEVWMQTSPSHKPGSTCTIDSPALHCLRKVANINKDH